MEYDEDKVADVILALLYLNSFDDHGLIRAWKSFDWAARDRLHAKDFISDPKSKAKSIVLTEEGYQEAAELFTEFFGSRAIRLSAS